jgi:signal transduction histidine kinase
MTYGDIYATYTAALKKAGLSKAENLHHVFKARVGLKRVQKISFPDGLPGQHTWNLGPGVYLANSVAIRAANAKAARASPGKLRLKP